MFIGISLALTQGTGGGGVFVDDTNLSLAMFVDDLGRPLNMFTDDLGRRL